MSKIRLERLRILQVGVHEVIQANVPVLDYADIFVGYSIIYTDESLL